MGFAQRIRRAAMQGASHEAVASMLARPSLALHPEAMAWHEDGERRRQHRRV
jgi:hypothetical protein